MRTLLASALPILALSAACASAPGSGSDTGEDVAGAESGFTAEACGELSAPGWIKTERMDVLGASLRVGVKEPSGPLRGDVMFLEGFADRFDNHKPLFDALAAAGLRVIAFDYPSHGETCGKGLNSFDFVQLAEMAGKVDQAKASAGKPLYLAGWSTGGLLAVRMAQKNNPTSGLRPIAGMALLAPGVDVQFVLSVDPATLTSNPEPPHVAGPKPSSPLAVPLFAAALKINALKSQAPVNGVPTLVITGDLEKDKYVDTAGVRSWVDARIAGGDPVTGLSCPALGEDGATGGRHELDNEPDPQGSAVRTAAVEFLASGGSKKPRAGGGCDPY